MKEYLKNLLLEKNICKSIYDHMTIDGHFGLSFSDQIDFICTADAKTQSTIRNNFVTIDFKNGDVKHFWDHITKGMLASQGY